MKANSSKGTVVFIHEFAVTKHYSFKFTLYIGAFGNNCMYYVYHFGAAIVLITL